MSRAAPRSLAPGDPRILVLGYGNPGRQDDGLGPALAAGIDALGWSNITAYDNYQLTIEDALEIAEHDIVWFVDAAKAGPSPYQVRDLSAAPSIEFTSHIVKPEAILAIALHYFGKSPPAFLLAVRGYRFDFVEELTAGAANNLRLALTMLTDKIRASLTLVAP
jgi:hydrogenase maturation protease